MKSDARRPAEVATLLSDWVHFSSTRLAIQAFLESLVGKLELSNAHKLRDHLLLSRGYR
jgi:hypothetical protein